MVQSIVTTANAQRWQSALERAISNALDVLVSTSGEVFVESSSIPGLLYAVSRESCTCPAGEKGQPCQHRACYLAQIGELGPQAPEPSGIQFVCNHSDRYQVLIDGQVFGDAVATEYGGWELFQGRFPHAKRRGTYCSLDEIERDLAARLPVPLQVQPAVQVTDLIGAAAA